MAQAKSDYIIEVIGVDKAGAVLASVEAQQDKVTAATVKSSKESEKFTQAINRSYLSIRAVVGDVTRAISAMWTAAREGARELDIQRQFVEVVGDAQAKLDAITKGTRGTAEDDQLERILIGLRKTKLELADLENLGTVAAARAVQTGEETAAVAERIARAFQKERWAGLREFGIVAQDNKGALRQLGIVAGEMTGSLDDSFEVTARKIEVYWADMVDDMKSSWSEFVFGVVEGNDALVSALSRTYSDTIPKMQRLQKLSEEIAVLEGKQEWARYVFGAPGQPDPAISARIVALKAEEKALRDFLAAQRAAGIDTFDRGGAPPVGIDPTAAGAAGFVSAVAARAMKDAKSRGGRGGRGGAGGGEPNAPSYAEIFGFSGSEASFLGGLSGGTLGGALMGTGETDQGNSGQRGGAGVLKNAGPMLDQSTQVMLDFAETMREVQSDVGDAFGGIGDAFGGMIDALTDSGAISKTGAAAKALAAVQLTALAAQAGVKAVWEFAEGLAASARYEYWSAAQHFAASIQYGVVAGTNIAKAINGGGASGGAGKSSSDRPSQSTDYLAERNAQPAGPTVIVINGPAADYSQATVDALNLLARKGIHIPVDVLPTELRRQMSRYSQAA